MKASDFIGPPCDCGECVQAGVAELESRRDPDSGRWMHGYQRKRFEERFQEFRRAARKAVGAPGRHAKGFEKLAGGS